MKNSRNWANATTVTLIDHVMNTFSLQTLHKFGQTMKPMFKVLRRCIGTEELKNIIKATESGFNDVLKKVKIIKAEDGVCLGELKIEKEHTNPLDGLHGGLTATIVDALTTYALFTHTKCESVPSVSVDLHVSYMTGIGCGKEILINAYTVKAGKTLAFTECTITNKENGVVVAKGNHTKYLLRSKE